MSSCRLKFGKKVQDLLMVNQVLLKTSLDMVFKGYRYQIQMKIRYVATYSESERNFIIR